MVAGSTRDLVAATLLGVVDGERVDDLERLTGGASRETWRGRIGDDLYVVQRRRAGAERDMVVEADVLRAAAAAGVPAPPVVDCVEAPDGTTSLVTRYVPGETIARKLLRDDEYETARGGLVGQLAIALARLHRIPATSVPELEPVDVVDMYRATMDELGQPHPAFELAFRWLDEHRPPPTTSTPVVLHGDFRLGNMIVDRDGLAAVIDWELAHIGDPMEDLGWMCVPAWRFGSQLPAAGVGTRDELLAAYAEASGTAVDREVLRWWEVAGIVRWGVMCITQTQAHRLGFARSHELAAIGRRVCENEHDLFLALEGRW
jgi:aminoglycoside phosphotransferase (APT) family kinase protein